VPTPLTVMIRALEAAVTGDPDIVRQVFTPDVVGWSPNVAISSRADLEEEVRDRDDVLTNVEVMVDAFDMVADKAIAEWRIAGDHTGPLLIGDDVLVEPSGRRVQFAGATFAELRGDHICAFRSYFDDAALLEQLLILR
jgi:predicted ester cyclase